MPLSVAELLDIFDASTDTFTLSADTLGLEFARPIFSGALDGDLVVATPEFAPEALAVTGLVSVPGLGDARPARVRFTADTDNKSLTGVALRVGCDAWVVDAPFLATDLSVLSELGFTALDVLLEALPSPAEGAPTGVVIDIAVGFAPPGSAHTGWLRGSGGDRHIGLYGDLPVDGPAVDLVDLADLPFLEADFATGLDVPAPLREVLSAVTLRSVGIEVDLAARRVERVWCALRIAPADPWDVIPGWLVLDRIDPFVLIAERRSDPTGTWSVTAVVNARCTLAGRYVLEASVSLPRGRLTASVSRPGGAADLIGGELEGTGIEPSVDLAYLAVDLDLATKAYSLGLGLDTRWEFADHVVVTGLELVLSGQGGVAAGAELRGVVDLGGGASAEVVGRRADGVWSVAGAAYGLDAAVLAAWFEASFDQRLPEAVAGLALSQVRLDLDSRPSGSVTCAGTLALGDSGAGGAFTLHAGISPTGALFTARLDLDVLLEGSPYAMPFEVDLQQGPGATRFRASWGPNDRAVPLLPVLEALGLSEFGDLEDALPAALSPGLRELAIEYDAGAGLTVVRARSDAVSIVLASGLDEGGTRAWAAYVSVAVAVGLSQVPLLRGTIPPGADLGLSGAGVVVSARPVSRALLDRFNAALRDGGPMLPVVDARQGGLPGGAWLALEYTVPGQDPALLTFPIGERKPRPPGRDGVLEGVVLAPGAGPAPAAPGRAGSWVDIGRAFGPLLVRRVGLDYRDGVVWLMVDGALTAAGFTMAVDGLAVGVDLDAEGFPARTRLSGLAVEFERPPLRIAGALLDRTPPDGDLFVAGTLIVQMPRFGVTAVGAYQRRGGMTSLFVFGRGTGALGGPPPFRVTGVAAGFGFNSGLRVPGPTEVADFPLVGEVDAHPPSAPLEMLDSLTRDWVRARQGSLWLAAGLDFTSFEFIKGRLLLILEAGNDLTLALVGTARAAFPPKGRAFAQVQLQLRIVYSSARAEFAATAMLYDSYVLDPSCVLTGGFAFHMWFDGSAHAGDFALTAGGYHPGFTAPGHYPQVPRLGFTWSLGAVDISGTSFFALTPSAVMAGGTLDVRYSSGPLKAWLSAYAHLLISWKPFHFALGVGITIGASLKVVFVTLKGELSATLNLWGPPTGGRVTAKFVFVKVTVTFGPGNTGAKVLTWPEFTELLPPTDKVLRIGAAEGILADSEPPPGRDAADPDGPWLVDASGFTFVAETSVPASSVRFQNRTPDAGTALDIRPMQERGKTSPFTVRITRNTAARGAAPRWEPLDNDGSWQADPILGAVPTALWGPPKPSKDEILDPDRRLLSGRRTGLRVTVPPPVSTGTPLGPIREASLAYEDLPDADGPLDPADPPTGDRSRSAIGTGAGIVADTIATPTTVSARTRLADALAGLLDPLPNAPLADFVTRVRAYGLPADPLLVEPAAAAAAAGGGGGGDDETTQPRPQGSA
ncbi:DUF6603 domain-containing protein [Embleya sp. MST-111070]|uniref:DUF6603 domain-containing protein n=1 Tax=Embleya sp. MST-111070 TaxID=3398231 RepID=UPI003F734906